MFAACGSATGQEKPDEGAEFHDPPTCGQTEVEKDAEGKGDTKLLSRE